MMNLILFLTLFISISSYPYGGIHHRHGRGAWAYSTSVVVRCFSGDSFIQLANGKTKLISYLKSGDKIMTIDQTNLISTEIILILDKHSSKQALFYTFQTESGHQISLTEYHLIPIKDFNYKFAKEIVKGDLLYIINNSSRIELSPVNNITIQTKKGYFAPLTIKGTLLVNQILASSFAHVNNHHLAQLYFYPFTIYYKLTKFFYLNNLFFNNNCQGLHWIIDILFHLTRYFRPQLLFLS